MISFKRREGLAAVVATLACTLAPAARSASFTGSGKLADETRESGAFTAIALKGGIDLLVRPGAREAVQVGGDDNLLALVRTAVQTRDGVRTLHIDIEPGVSILGRHRLLVTVDVMRLLAIESKGSGDIRVAGLATPSLSLSISGSSDAKLERLDTGTLSVDIAGSGDVDAEGRASRLDIAVAGSGTVRARALSADDVSVSIAGSGDAVVQAARTLAVSIAGSGSVEYSGAAQITRSAVAGSGSIRQRR